MIKVSSVETRFLPVVGICGICKKENVPLKRTYFYFDDIKCECHSPQHFELVEHCHNCVPKLPNKTKVTYKVDNSEKEIRRLKLKNILK